MLKCTRGTLKATYSIYLLSDLRSYELLVGLSQLDIREVQSRQVPRKGGAVLYKNLYSPLPIPASLEERKAEKGYQMACGGGGGGIN